MLYAQEYSKNQKIIRLSAFAILYGIVIYVCERFFLPQLRLLIEHPNCVTWFGVSGTKFVWHLVFIGIPGLILLPTLFAMPIGIKALKEKQFPPSSMKVYRRTRIRTGWTAKIQAITLTLMPLIVLGLMLLLLPFVNELSSQMPVELPPCEGIDSLIKHSAQSASSVS